MKARVLITLLIILLCGDAWARDKTDIIWLNNGDRLTGEIKQLERGRLLLGTDSMGTVSIEWKEVEKIESTYEFQFEQTDGKRNTGYLEQTPAQKEIMLRNDEQTLAIEHDKIVRISPMEDRFRDRLKVSLSLGYSFTKASDVAQGNLSFQVSHRTEIRSLSASGSTIVTTDQADETTQRSNLSLTMYRFRKNRWFSAYQMQFEKNDELGLNLRSSVGAGLGRYLVQTGISEFALIGGLVATRETLSNDVSSESNLEGALGAEYSRYIFDDPTVDLNVRFSVFPGITDSGRERAQLDANVRWELFKDLFWELSYYNTYDSDPPSGTNSTNDYGIVTSLGWSY